MTQTCRTLQNEDLGNGRMSILDLYFLDLFFLCYYRCLQNRWRSPFLARACAHFRAKLVSVNVTHGTTARFSTNFEFSRRIFYGEESLEA